MTVTVISFYDEIKDPESLNSTYSRVWGTLQKQYGHPINKDGNGSCFRGNDGQTAVLTDNSLSSSIHELILIDVSKTVVEGLEKIIAK
ncbi:MAG: hypothetical protein WC979_05015 [Candidatus Pacearchaeota archaeon]|jgi:hypothetical protein